MMRRGAPTPVTDSCLAAPGTCQCVMPVVTVTVTVAAAGGAGGHGCRGVLVGPRGPGPKAVTVGSSRHEPAQFRPRRDDSALGARAGWLLGH